MAREKCKEIESLMNKSEIHNNSVVKRNIHRIIPGTKWNVWCYEKWRFAPGLRRLQKDSELTVLFNMFGHH